MVCLFPQQPRLSWSLNDYLLETTAHLLSVSCPLQTVWTLEDN